VVVISRRPRGPFWHIFVPNDEVLQRVIFIILVLVVFFAISTKIFIIFRVGCHILGVVVMVVMVVVREMRKSKMRNAYEVAKVMVVATYRIHVKLQIFSLEVAIKLIIVNITEVEPTTIDW
jgi:hypothetical protein